MAVATELSVYLFKSPPFQEKAEQPKRRSMVKVAPLAAPQLGSCASSGRAWRLWATRNSQGEARPNGRPVIASGARTSRLQAAESPPFILPSRRLREIDATELVARAGRLSSDELQRARAAHAAELGAKNAQIERFRAEMDAITGELVHLHERQSEAVALRG